jgi:hypothetical protein
MLCHTTLRTAAAAAIATCALAPAAQAGFDLNPPATGSAASRYTPQALRAMGLRDAAPASFDTAQAQASASPGFNWADAGIGAAGMIAILGAAGASTTLIRHRRHSPRLAS